MLSRLGGVARRRRGVLSKETRISGRLCASNESFVMSDEGVLGRNGLVAIHARAQFICFPTRERGFVRILCMYRNSIAGVVSNGGMIIKGNRLLFLGRCAGRRLLPTKRDSVTVGFVVLPRFFSITCSVTKQGGILTSFLMGVLHRSRRGKRCLCFEITRILRVRGLLRGVVCSLIANGNRGGQVGRAAVKLVFLCLISSMRCIRVHIPGRCRGVVSVAALSCVRRGCGATALARLYRALRLPVRILDGVVGGAANFGFGRLLREGHLGGSMRLVYSASLTVDSVVTTIKCRGGDCFRQMFGRECRVAPETFERRGERRTRMEL